MAENGVDKGTGYGKLNGDSPFAGYYSEKFGYVFGKPFSFLPNTDPSQRVFQGTMLKNNTIVNLVPGKSRYQASDIEKDIAPILKLADDAAKKAYSQYFNTDIVTYEEQMVKINRQYQGELISKGVDLRTSIFQKDIPGHLQYFQQLVTQTGIAMFGGTFLSTGISALLKGFAPDEKLRGYKLWTERATNVSESFENSYQSSVFEQYSKEITHLSSEVAYMTGTAMGRFNPATTTVTSNDNTAQQAASLVTLAGKVLTGSQLILPKFWSDGSFGRSYEISFKFMSPYGDNISCFNHVMLPFLFLLSLSVPKQDGPSGMSAPFMIQIDAPGFFSCPMGAVSSISFKKGGDNMWFNAAGLPLIIEGSMTVIDLYSALSLPGSYSENLVNIGTRAYLNTMAGLTLYNTMDATLEQQAENRLLQLAKLPSYPIALAKESVADMRRYFGVATKDY
jgi:hypothetical protein